MGRDRGREAERWRAPLSPERRGRQPWPEPLRRGPQPHRGVKPGFRQGNLVLAEEVGRRGHGGGRAPGIESAVGGGRDQGKQGEQAAGRGYKGLA